MKSYTTALLLSVIFVVSANAQIPMGYFYDADHTPIEGYFDVLGYSPETSLTYTHNSSSFEKGSYYMLSGERVDGLIKFENKKFWYKANDSSTKEKLRPVEIKGMLVGIDSFFTITNFVVENGGIVGSSLRMKPELVQFITQIGKHVYAKHYNFPSNMSMNNEIIETYLVKEVDNNSWTSFPNNNSRFKKTGLKYFGHIAHLKNQIESGKLKSEDMMTLIKTAEYLTKYEKNENLLFDSYWQETSEKSRAKYEAKITNIEDSIWTMEYYEEGVKLVRTQYSSFQPNRRNGTFEWYYPGGGIRRSVIYKNDDPKEAKLYFENGNLLQHYKIVKDDFEETNSYNYITYNDEQGNSLLDETGSGIAKLDDRFFERQIVQELKNFKIQSSYIASGTSKVYQLSNEKLQFKIKPFRKKFNQDLATVELEDAVADNAQGVIMIYIEISPKGYVNNYKVLNKVHPQMDKLVEDFLADNISESAYFKHVFRPIKLNKEKISYEIVIPVSLAINRFYRKPQTWYYNPMWMNHQMMFNQMPNITPPPMPGFR